MNSFNYNIVKKSGKIFYVDNSGSYFYRELIASAEALYGTTISKSSLFKNFIVSISDSRYPNSIISDIATDIGRQLMLLDDPDYTFDTFEVDITVAFAATDLNLAIAKIGYTAMDGLGQGILEGLMPDTKLLLVLDNLKHKLLKSLLDIRMVDIKSDIFNSNHNSLSDIYVRYLIGEGLLLNTDFDNAKLIFDYVNKEYLSWMNK